MQKIDPMGWRFDDSRDTLAIRNDKGNHRYNVNSLACGLYLVPGGASDQHMQAARVDKSRNCIAHNPGLANSIAKGHWSFVVPVDVSPYVKGRSSGTARKQHQAVLVLSAIAYGAAVPSYYKDCVVADTLADAKAGDTRVFTAGDLRQWIADSRVAGTA